MEGQENAATDALILIEGYDPLKAKKEEQVNSWHRIRAAYENNRILQAKIIGIEALQGKKTETHCAVVQYEDIRGYIPIDEMSENGMTIQAVRGRVGTPVMFLITQCLSGDSENQPNLFIASRKKAQQRASEITFRHINEGDEIIAVVQQIGINRVLVDIGGIEIYIPIKEMSHGWIDSLADVVEVGQHIKVKVTEIDKEQKKVEVSHKATLPDPWTNIHQIFKEGSEYVGKVSGVVEKGIYVNLANGIDSRAKHLKFENVIDGDLVLVRLDSIATAKQKIKSTIIRVL